MEVTLSQPAPSDAGEFIDAVRASRPLHRPWLELPDTPELFAAYVDRTAREDQANYLIRHRACGRLVGVVNVSNIVRGGFQSGYLGYAAFASHAGQGLMTEGLRSPRLLGPCGRDSQARLRAMGNAAGAVSLLNIMYIIG